jgi:hypothetical protein
MVRGSDDSAAQLIVRLRSGTFAGAGRGCRPFISSVMSDVCDSTEANADG